MNKTVVGMIVAALVLTGGVWLYNSFKATEEASGPMAAAPVGGGGAAKTYEIDQMASEARFIIHEELRGAPKEVVGTTNQVAGQFAASLSDLGTAKLGEIKVNARTLKTDEEMRDRMTGNRILNTAQYEFITFAPTAIVGLSGSAAPGDERRFQVQGNLTVRDATRPVVFDVTMNVVSENELSVEANTTIRRSDFGIEVRGPAFVANVGDEVRLEYRGKLRAV